MDDDPRRPLALAHLVDGLGYLVEADHPADARRWIKSAIGDGVERSVPVLRMRAAAELDRHALVCGIGAVDGARVVPPARYVNARHELARVDDALQKAVLADAFE